MKIIEQKISIEELKELTKKMYGNLVKADVDIAKGLLIVDMAMHADGEKYLLDSGSNQGDLWGINIYPDKEGENMIEFDSMINIRPNEGNMSRYVDDEKIRKQIFDLVLSKIEK